MPEKYHDDVYETASEDESDRAKKDKAISQAPYLPRIQVWARDNGPYTLRVGHKWFHCDDLLVNGTEYRTVTGKSGRQSTQPARRPGPNRAQSYVRSRPEKSTTYPPPASPRTSNETVSSSKYPSQSIPARERHKADTGRRERRDSAISMNSERGNQAAVVPYTPSQPSSQPSRPRLDRQPSRQGAIRQALRGRPGAVRRGSSYEIPVRSRGRKNVRFAPLPVPPQV